MVRTSDAGAILVMQITDVTVDRRSCTKDRLMAVGQRSCKEGPSFAYQWAGSLTNSDELECGRHVIASFCSIYDTKKKRRVFCDIEFSVDDPGSAQKGCRVGVDVFFSIDHPLRACSPSLARCEERTSNSTPGSHLSVQKTYRGQTIVSDAPCRFKSRNTVLAVGLEETHVGEVCRRQKHAVRHTVVVYNRR